MEASVLVLLLLVFFSADYGSCANDHALRRSFPKGFVFGTASSAAQYEGAAAEGGRGPSIWDPWSHIPGKIADGSTPDVAVDQYHRYKEDVGLMVNLGVDAYRFSISWSRIFPNGSGRINEEGIRYYNNLIDELISHGIQPYVTLSHFDVPQALEDAYGSWLSPKIVDDFAAFAETCFKAFGDRVKHWITLNEPHIVSNFGYNVGSFPPQRCSKDVGNCTHGDSSVEPYIVAHHFLLSHAAATNIYRTKYKEEQGGLIGTTLDTQWYEPFSNSSKDLAATDRAQHFNLAWMMDPLIFGDYPQLLQSIVGEKLPKFTKEQSEMLRGSCDFVGINHYSSLYVADITTPNTGSEALFSQQSYYKHVNAHLTDKRNGRLIGRSANGFNVFPPGFRRLLNYIRLRYNNPTIIITENGTSDTRNSTRAILRDKERIEYLRAYLSNLAAAMRDGCNVKGYFVWSLLDNWEWGRGSAIRFGLYHVDYNANLTRTPKMSALWYKKFLRHA